MTKYSRQVSGLGQGDAANDNGPDDELADDVGQVEHDDGRVETGTVTDDDTTEAPSE